MGTKGREIVGTDVGGLIKKLNKALADEWLAYYQYWVGAIIAKGPARSNVAAELLEHADDELRHAGLLAERIVQLGGDILLSPKDWYEVTTCGYEVPSDPHVEVLLEQNIKGEQCAIGVYQGLTELTQGKDPITYAMALEILSDEVEHEEDLQAIAEDIQLMKGGK
jgi:bacterioferritin